MLVYTTGVGVHGFTLDPSIGEFVLSHADIRIPEPSARIYSVNEAYAHRWDEGMRRLVEGFKSEPFSARYVGSLVADAHRTLLQGGIFMYPADRTNSCGKLRLLYEAAPMAFLFEQAGGRASDGTRDIADIEPTELHQRTPLFLGTGSLVDRAEDALSGGV
jgi:fructose-1,6-bisphosphatase I